MATVRTAVAAVRTRSTAARERARGLVFQVLDTVPPVRRMAEELVRISLIDRCMVIGAQSLLALIPTLIVLAAFLPSELTGYATNQFADLSGIDAQQVMGEDIDSESVRAQTGLVGILVTLFSATSFAKAVQRTYEGVWEQPHIGGLVGRRRCLGWLLAWLFLLQLPAELAAVLPEGLVLDTLQLVLEAVLVSLIWWWTLRVLLFGRVAWRALVVAAVITGAGAVAYSAGSALVMPRYAAASAAEFGVLGLVLTVATWLIGFAGVMVLAAILGRIITEDQWLRARMADAAALVRLRRQG